MTVKEAIRVLLSDKSSYTTSLNWAVNYCQAGLSMAEGSEELRVQCLYILNNIRGWRHPEAKAVRDALKKGAKR